MSKREVLSDIVERCTKLRQGAKDFFIKRNLTLDIINKFQLGFFPINFEGFLKRYPLQLLIDLKIVFLSDSKSLYCPFAGRVVFPVVNQYGEIVALFGRTLNNDKIKYINSDYSKKNNWFGLNFAINEIRRKDKAYVVEGNVCVMTAWKCGIYNIVASCGAHPSQEQIDLLARYASQITLVPDTDAAGLDALQRTLKKRVKPGIELNRVLLPFGKDLDEFLQKHSAADFYSLEAVEIQDRLLQRAGSVL